MMFHPQGSFRPFFPHFRQIMLHHAFSFPKLLGYFGAFELLFSKGYEWWRGAGFSHLAFQLAQRGIRCKFLSSEGRAARRISKKK
jgi:hypothetical protein